MRKINFDPNDLTSIEEMIDKVNEVGCMLHGTTEDDEDILFDVIVCGTEDVLKTEVTQKNGWTRINHYYLDGTIEETYKR